MNSSCVAASSFENTDAEDSVSAPPNPKISCRRSELWMTTVEFATTALRPVGLRLLLLLLLLALGGKKGTGGTGVSGTEPCMVLTARSTPGVAGRMGARCVSQESAVIGAAAAVHAAATSMVSMILCRRAGDSIRWRGRLPGARVPHAFYRLFGARGVRVPAEPCCLSGRERRDVELLELE